MFCNAITSAQPKVKISPKAYAEANQKYEFVKVHKAANGKYGYTYEIGLPTKENTKTYIKPIFEWCSEVFKRSENTILSFVKHNGKYYILNLSDGSYLSLNGNHEFTACPIRIDTGGYIYEVEAGIFMTKYGTQSPVEKKITNGNTTYYWCNDGTTYRVSKEEPLEGVRSFCRFNIPSPDGTFFTGLGVLEYGLINSNDMSVIERYVLLKQESDIIIVVKENLDCGIYYDGKYIPLDCTIFPIENQSESLKFQLRDNRKLRELISSQLLNKMLDGSTDFMIHRDCDFYAYKTPDQANILVYKGKEVYRDESGITIDLKTFPLVQIEKEGLYGLIDIEKHSIIVEPKLISPIHISRGKYKRYKTSVGKDIITDGYICYSVPEYENHLYKQINDHIDSYSYYEECVKNYFSDCLLTKSERTHTYEELLSRQKEYVKKLDERLYSKLSCEEYVFTHQLPDKFKTHLMTAKRTLENKKAFYRRNSSESGIYNAFPFGDNNCYEEETIDGNIYTYKVFAKNGFIFRKCESLSKVDIIIDFNGDYKQRSYKTYEPAGLPIDFHEFTGDVSGDYHDLEYRWSYKTGEKIFLIYDYNIIEPVNTGKWFIDIVDVVPNPVTGVPQMVYGKKNIYTRIDNSERFVTIISKTKIEKRISIPFSFGLPCVKGDYAVFKGGKNVLCINFDGEIILQYDGDYGTMIHDVGRALDGRWILVGSTTTRGYVDYNNYYVAILDDKGQKLKDHYKAIKGDELKSISTPDIDKFQVHTAQGDYITFVVNTDNSITWIE